LKPVNGAKVFVIRTSAVACTTHVAVAELLPVLYSGLAVVVLAIWLNVVPTANACVIGAFKRIVIVCHGFRLLK
jgi:hypothetical protein